MSNSTDPKKMVQEHYDAVAKSYHQYYERERLHDVSVPYPSNYFRLQLLLNSFVQKNVRRVIEVGVGEGTPLVTLAKAGVDVWGFDISEGMVEKCKDNLRGSHLDPERVFWGDIQDPITYAGALQNGPFDALMAMGVMPHVENDEMVLENMATLVKPGGSVFIEFRNKLFSLFTFNRYTLEFILDDLLGGVDERIKQIVAKELKPRLRMDMPPERKTVPDSGAPGYDVLLSKFHNPFEVIPMFEKHDFTDVRLLWYHYHPAMPFLEKETPELFRREAVRMEHDPSGWRGFFLCSAFVVEAVKSDKV